MGHERILVEQDNDLRDSILSDISQFRGPFEKVIEAFEALNMGEMTNDVFEQIKNNRAGQIVKQYNEKLAQELDGAKIINPTLRASLLTGTSEPSKAFLKAVSEFASTEVKSTSYIQKRINSDVRLTIEDISFEDGELYISESDKESITEKYCRFYLETEDEQKAFEAAKIITEQYKIMMDLDKRLGMNLNRSYMNCIQDFFIDIGEDIKPNKRFIAGLSARMERLKKYR